MASKRRLKSLFGVFLRLFESAEGKDRFWRQFRREPTVPIFRTLDHVSFIFLASHALCAACVVCSLFHAHQTLLRRQDFRFLSDQVHQLRYTGVRYSAIFLLLFCCYAAVLLLFCCYPAATRWLLRCYPVATLYYSAVTLLLFYCYE